MKDIFLKFIRIDESERPIFDAYYDDDRLTMNRRLFSMRMVSSPKNTDETEAEEVKPSDKV